MFKTFFTVLLIFVFVLSFTAIAGKYDFQRATKVTPENDVEFQNQLTGINSAINIEKLPNELGRTWYDYATNNVMGRMMAHALDTNDGFDGLHFVFMKRQPNAAGTRYVTYDYYDFNSGLFFGNQSITETQATGWGRIVNGENDVPIIVMHGGGLHIFQDASEFGYSFTEIFDSGDDGVFPGIARTGDNVFFMGQLTNGNWLGGDTVMVSTDYMNSWTGYNIWPEELTVTDYGTGEMWPSINPVNNTDISVVYCPDITAAAPNGITKMATTSDWGATWTTMDIHNDDTIIGNTQYIIENFGQYNSMYGQDGTFHVVMGAVQGVIDTLTSAVIDYFPILYWNTREQSLVELSDIRKSNPSDSVAGILTDNRPGNGLGGFNYPHLAEGPNGELVVIWQEWEEDESGLPVMANPTGGAGINVFCTDIWGAYSDDGGLTWGEPFFITGTAGESDVYPNITKNFLLNTAGDSVILDIAYMFDTNASVSLNNFGTWTDPTEVIWYYERVAFAEADIVNGITNGNYAIVDEFELSQNYPNPFNPSTNISFTVSKATDVTLDVFNTLGEKVATLINGKVKVGETVVSFNGANHASGVYFYQLTAGNVVETRKMLLVK